MSCNTCAKHSVFRFDTNDPGDFTLIALSGYNGNSANDAFPVCGRQTSSHLQLIPATRGSTKGKTKEEPRFSAIAFLRLARQVVSAAGFSP
jgi:hypothetical protein